MERRGREVYLPHIKDGLPVSPNLSFLLKNRKIAMSNLKEKLRALSILTKK